MSDKLLLCHELQEAGEKIFFVGFFQVFFLQWPKRTTAGEFPPLIETGGSISTWLSQCSSPPSSIEPFLVSQAACERVGGYFFPEVVVSLSFPSFKRQASQPAFPPCFSAVLSQLCHGGRSAVAAGEVRYIVHNRGIRRVGILCKEREKREGGGVCVKL